MSPRRSSQKPKNPSKKKIDINILLGVLGIIITIVLWKYPIPNNVVVEHTIYRNNTIINPNVTFHVTATTTVTVTRANQTVTVYLPIDKNSQIQPR
jgi:hypothetical protein